MPKNQYPGDVARAFAEISRTLLAAETVEQTLRCIVDLAVATIDGCDYAAVSIVQPGGDITTPAVSHEAVQKWDALQYDLGEGPCVDAIWERHPFESDDLSQERRWPTWLPKSSTSGPAA